ATLVASLALAEVYRGGWFGKVSRDGRQGTSNVGSISDAAGGSAGQATNVVTDFALVRGESRSHDIRFAGAITAAYRRAFQEAAKQVADHRGRHARICFRRRRDYYPFRLPDDAPVVRHAQAAAEGAGMTPILRTTNGGLDANWMVRHGIPTITFGAGQRDVHTVEEYVDLPDFLGGCRLALALATHGAA
ncbi:MAG: M20/M25/M40 family metallo-hydrolase, partial [Streptosporangiales bacterium]